MSDEESTDKLSEPAELRVTRSPKSLTTEQAAAVLGVSCPTVIRLIEAGKLDTHMVGNVLAHREATAARRKAALDDMAHEAEELGLYD